MSTTTRLKQIDSFQRETIRDEQFVCVIPNNNQPKDYVEENPGG